jgi:hypothetical protein
MALGWSPRGSYSQTSLNREDAARGEPEVTVTGLGSWGNAVRRSSDGPGVARVGLMMIPHPVQIISDGLWSIGSCVGERVVVGHFRCGLAGVIREPLRLRSQRIFAVG